MNLKFLIINADYPGFIEWLYAQHPGLASRSYAEQLQERVTSLYSEADFYSSNLRKLGHEADDIFANNEFMQRTWAHEHGMNLVERQWQFRLRRGFVPWLSRVSEQRWFYSILRAQIEYHKPDVLLNHDLWGINTGFLREMKPYVGLLVGQHAATRFPQNRDLKGYDLVVSSFPPTVEFFRQNEICAELVRLGFEPKVLSGLDPAGELYDVSFVGSFSAVHSSRTVMLEALCTQFKQLHIWGPTVDSLAHDSSIRSHYRGPAWGHEMYGILRRTKIVLNHHGDVAPYANNMRLYEATGMGAMLLTDWKANLHEMFAPGKEVVTYRSPEECAEMINYYLVHEEERRTIAQAGQVRTLRQHTYAHRMQELVDILIPMVRQRGKQVPARAHNEISNKFSPESGNNCF